MEKGKGSKQERDSESLLGAEIIKTLRFGDDKKLLQLSKFFNNFCIIKMNPKINTFLKFRVRRIKNIRTSRECERDGTWVCLSLFC